MGYLWQQQSIRKYRLFSLLWPAYDGPLLRTHCNTIVAMCSWGANRAGKMWKTCLNTTISVLGRPQWTKRRLRLKSRSILWSPMKRPPPWRDNATLKVLKRLLEQSRITQRSKNVNFVKIFALSQSETKWSKHCALYALAKTKKFKLMISKSSLIGLRRKSRAGEQCFKHRRWVMS